MVVFWKFVNVIIPKGGGAITRRNGFGAIEFHRLSKRIFLFCFLFGAYLLFLWPFLFCSDVYKNVPTA
jgi:hypothetical protein